MIKVDEAKVRLAASAFLKDDDLGFDAQTGMQYASHVCSGALHVRNPTNRMLLYSTSF